MVELDKKTMGSKRLLSPIEPFLFIFGSAEPEMIRPAAAAKLDGLYN